MTLSEFITLNRPYMLKELTRLAAQCRIQLRKNPELFVDLEHPTPCIDVRLCINKPNHISPGWHWSIATGSVQYDLARWDYCGMSCVDLDTLESTLLNMMIGQIESAV